MSIAACFRATSLAKRKSGLHQKRNVRIFSLAQAFTPRGSEDTPPPSHFPSGPLKGARREMGGLNVLTPQA